jgi:4-amino-4-deoxy-L-arabinose transferase-like glycosyltransferase
MATKGRRESNQIAHRLVLSAILAIAAAARFWDLGGAGFGTEYYAAAVRSMLASPHNLFYAAFDPAGVLAIDKPPLAFWIQAASARLLGFTPFALALPQAIEGCLSVLLTWTLVRRESGTWAAAFAAFFLAITPVSIAVDRSNNTDSLLVLVLLCAARAMPRPGGKSMAVRLVLAFALVGAAFNVKMLAAFGVLPGFALSYLVSADIPWRRRIAHLTLASAALLVVSVSWIGAVAMTPAADRPYVDSSASNSIFDLVVNHNAAQRFVHRDRTEAAASRFQARVPPPGILRLADPGLASQCLWLLPLALAGAIAARRAAACVWIGWAVAYGAVFSAAGGLFSPYYMVLLAPPLAVLAGTGAITLWRGAPSRLAGALGACAAWQAHVVSPETAWGARGILAIVLLAGAVLAGGALMAGPHRMRGAALAAGIASLCVAPAAWAIGTISSEGGRPIARLARAQDRPRRATGAEGGQVRAMLPFLLAHQGDAKFLAATSNALLAAPLIAATGLPAIAFGGSQGTMPVVGAAALAGLVDTGALRYAILGQRGPRRRETVETASAQWIRAHGTLVQGVTIAPGPDAGRLDLFDLRPGARTGTE